MKAIHFTGYGKLQDKIILKDIPMPIPSDNEVLIKIYAASVNPIDYKLVHGLLKLIHHFKLPSRLGYDVSGVVSSVGKNVTEFKPGDEVFSWVGTSSPGTFAEYISVNSNYVSYKPVNLTHEEASCIPLVGLTSMQAISDFGKAKAGQKILIHAGSGGVGVFAIQYAKSLNLHVATTTSTANVEWVKSLGADIVIDYKKQNYLDQIKDYDIVYDTLGGQTTLDSIKVLKEGGKLVSVAGPPDKLYAIKNNLNIFLNMVISLMGFKVRKAAKKHNISYNFIFLEPKEKQLAELAHLVETKNIQVHIEKTYALEQASEALQHVAAGRTKGKVVIKIV